jgi:hypothetical protein
VSVDDELARARKRRRLMRRVPEFATYDTDAQLRVEAEYDDSLRGRLDAVGDALRDVGRSLRRQLPRRRP